MSFRGDAKHRTMVRNCAPENLEIPRCAIAHLRSGANAPSRNDGVLGLLPGACHRAAEGETRWRGMTTVREFDPTGKSVRPLKSCPAPFAKIFRFAPDANQST